jgi:hypothetical protein
MSDRLETVDELFAVFSRRGLTVDEAVESICDLTHGLYVTYANGAPERERLAEMLDLMREKILSEFDEFMASEFGAQRREAVQ